MWHRRSGTQLVEPGDLGFWRSLWKTDVFRASIEDLSTGYASLLAAAASRPWWFVDAQHGYERRHFSVWFGQAIVRRQYENPVIEDLYYFHDMLHGLTFADGSRMDETAWRLAMRSNEIAVSMETEVLAYWRNPALRCKSFAQPIWQDQIVNGIPVRARERLLAYRARCQREQDSEMTQHETALRRALPAWPLAHDFCPRRDLPTREGLWELRRAISLAPDPDNAVEMELARYENQADPFYDGWRGKWREVEQERAIFAQLCREGQWRSAVVRRQQVWERASNEDGVPYGDIAQALAG